VTGKYPVRLAPQAGFEPATLRLTERNAGALSWWFFVGWPHPCYLVLPGVRERIVHGLFTAVGPRFSELLSSGGLARQQEGLRVSSVTTDFE